MKDNTKRKQDYGALQKKHEELEQQLADANLKIENYERERDKEKGEIIADIDKQIIGFDPEYGSALELQVPQNLQNINDNSELIKEILNERNKRISQVDADLARKYGPDVYGHALTYEKTNKK